MQHRQQEFINRFDEVIVFAIPSRSEVEQLAILMLDGIIKEVEKTRGITIRVEPAVIGILVDAGYDPSFGAREMRRTVGQKIETYLANIMLKNMPKRGDEILISAADIRGYYPPEPYKGKGVRYVGEHIVRKEGKTVQ